MIKHLRCSFCRKKDSEVSKLVAGPRVYICDECVAIATRLMDGPDSDNQPPVVKGWRKPLARIAHLIRGTNALRVGSPIASH